MLHTVTEGFFRLGLFIARNETVSKQLNQCVCQGWGKWSGAQGSRGRHGSPQRDLKGEARGNQEMRSNDITLIYHIM